MARRLIHSLFLTSLFSSLAVASPCKASSSTTALLSTTETTSEATSTTTPGDQTTTTSLTTSATEGTPTTTPATTTPDYTDTTSVCVETPQATPEPVCTSVGQTCEAQLEQVCDPNVNPIKNGNFESGDLCPWVLSDDNEACVYIGSNGAFGTSKTFRTSTKFKDNVYLEMYQDTWTCPNTRVYCTYQWYFNKYYITPNRYVPYFRIWNGNDEIGNRYPESDADAGHWMSGSFSFDTPSSGKNRIWITAQSPQVCLDNWFAIDEINCYVDVPQ
ncbi:uncharacterized protein AUP68_11497 [Ilyonectria robusta]